MPILGKLLLLASVAIFGCLIGYGILAESSTTRGARGTVVISTVYPANEREFVPEDMPSNLNPDDCWAAVRAYVRENHVSDPNVFNSLFGKLCRKGDNSNAKFDIGKMSKSNNVEDVRPKKNKPGEISDEVFYPVLCLIMIVLLSIVVLVARKPKQQ